MKNYICIDGKKAELTPEQLNALGIEVKGNHWSRKEGIYHYINEDGYVCDSRDNSGAISELRYKVANYCTDKAIMEQRALHETLNRLLWRYSMEHDGDKIDLNNKSKLKYEIVYYTDENRFNVFGYYVTHTVSGVNFYSKEIAQNAIKEIIEPFMKEHPEFKW